MDYYRVTTAMAAMKRAAMLAIIVMLLIVATASRAAPKPVYNIVTGPERATYIQFGNDLSKYVASDAKIELRVLPSKGSVENIRRLRDEKGTKLAIVQADVYDAYKNLAAHGNAEAARVITPLRVVLPLYDSDVHFVVRADSPLNWIHEIKNQRIDIGPLGSGSAMTTTALYHRLFDEDIAEKNLTTLSHEEALVKLIKDKSVDVVAVVSGQPVPIFLGMEPGVEKYFKLLKLDENDPTFSRLEGAYSKSTIKAASYPNWLKADSPSLSVKTFLVTYDYNLDATKDALVRFATSLCENLPVLQKQGHPKWRQVSLELPELTGGWRYYRPTQQAIQRCGKFKQKSVALCSLQEKVSGLCTEP